MASKYGERIEPVEVKRVTLSQVVFAQRTYSGRARRALKSSSCENYFPTWDEAKEFIVAEAERDIKRYQRNLEEAKSRFRKLVCLQPPSVPVEEGAAALPAPPSEVTNG
jgi:hypothetical protein